MFCNYLLMNVCRLLEDGQLKVFISSFKNILIYKYLFCSSMATSSWCCVVG